MSDFRIFSRDGTVSILRLPEEMGDSADTLLDSMLEPTFPPDVSALILDCGRIRTFNSTSVSFLAPFVMKGAALQVPIYLVALSDRNRRILELATIAPPRVRFATSVEAALTELRTGPA